MFSVDKTAFSIVSLFDDSDEKQYWQSKTPHERLQAIEQMRQVIYGYEPSTVRFQKICWEIGNNSQQTSVVYHAEP